MFGFRIIESDELKSYFKEHLLLVINVLKEGIPIKNLNVSYFLRVPFPNVIYMRFLIEDLLTNFLN